jgi:hypothetical protein
MSRTIYHRRKLVLTFDVGTTYKWYILLARVSSRLGVPIDGHTLFCIFSMSCSCAGLSWATGYSPKYVNYLLPLVVHPENHLWVFLKRSKRHFYKFYSKIAPSRHQKQFLFLMVRSHSTSNSRFQSYISPYPIRPKCPSPHITVSQCVHRCFWDWANQWFSYHPTESELFNPFPQTSKVFY